jgi:hypothetical protein
MSAGGPFFGPHNFPPSSISIKFGYDHGPEGDSLGISLYQSSSPSVPKLNIILSGNGTSLSSYTWTTSSGVSKNNFNYELPTTYSTIYTVICNNILRIMINSPTSTPILTVVDDLIVTFDTVYATGNSGETISMDVTSFLTPCCCNYTLPNALKIKTTSTSTSSSGYKAPLWLLILISVSSLTVGVTLGTAGIMLLKRRSKKQ